MAKLSLLVVLIGLLGACQFANAIECTGEISVKTTLTFTWKKEDETDTYPSNAHFSPIVCALSNEEVFFMSGKTVSEGFKILAETGISATLEEEIKANDKVMNYSITPGTSPGTSTGTFTTTITGKDASYLQCATMIAPSPDWVVGFPAASLCDEATGKFKDSTESDLEPYDAGTDSGTSYTAANSATDPAVPLKKATVGVISSYGNLKVEVSSSDEAEDDPACFSADSTVVLDDGSTITMDKLNVGDRVKVADGSFSEVYAFSHRVSTGKFDFVEMSTTSGRSLKTSAGHLVYANGSRKPAKSVKVGDALERADGSSEIVIKLASVKATGLYNPHTMNGDIIVNDFRASTFTTAIPAELANWLLAPFRVLFSLGVRNPTLNLLNHGAGVFESVLRKVVSHIA